MVRRRSIQAAASMAAAALLAVAAGAFPTAASATFPGSNGKITFWSQYQPSGSWQVRPSGAGAKRLIADHSASGAVVAPDGKTVAYENTVGERDSGIYIQSHGTSRLLTTAPGFEWGASFSGPTGRRVAYRQSRTASIWVSAVDGGRDLRLTNPRAIASNLRDDSPAFSPDGKWVAFERDSWTYLTRSNGTNTHRLERYAEFPSFSPDGDSLIYTGFSAYHGSYVGRAGIMTLHGRRIRWVTPKTADVFQAVFSPNGKRIAYLNDSYPRGYGIYTSDLHGHHVRRVVKFCDKCRFDGAAYLGWAVKPN